jgi:hypothetical protein
MSDGGNKIILKGLSHEMDLAFDVNAKSRYPQEKHFCVIKALEQLKIQKMAPSSI